MARENQVVKAAAQVSKMSPVDLLRSVNTEELDKDIKDIGAVRERFNAALGELRALMSMKKLEELDKDIGAARERFNAAQGELRALMLMKKLLDWRDGRGGRRGRRRGGR